MALPRNPVIYEINTWVWLADLSVQYGRPITLADVPAAVIDEIAGWQFDAVWLMGVWQRSPLGRQIAQTHPGLQMEYERALPGYTQADVVGSPYAVYRYEVDATLGGRPALAAFREQLAQRGLRLLLDYVPNHVAVDHHWTADCPDCLVQGVSSDPEQRPGYYYTSAETGRVFAYGRDPYYPGWTDTAQIDAFSATAREQSRTTLLDIATQCDGVRCDMAMLMVNHVFARTWRREDIPQTEFWEEIIPAVKARHADFTFMAEVYWDMEAELQSLGFDYTYDKRLYDRMRDQGASVIRDHLLAALSYQQKMVRFIENHDEQRAMAAFGLERSQAAAVLAVLLPGARLIHEGQLAGWRIKLPVQLGQRSTEPLLDSLNTFYQALLAQAAQPPYHNGAYMALAAHPVLGTDPGHEALIAFVWALGEDWRVVVVNYSAQLVKARIMIPRPALGGLQIWEFTDALSGASVLHVGDDLLTAGLPLELNAYGAQILTVRLASGCGRFRLNRCCDRLI